MGPGFIYRVNIFGINLKRMYNRRMEYIVLTGPLGRSQILYESTENTLVRRAELFSRDVDDVYDDHILTLGEKVDRFVQDNWEPLGGVSVTEIRSYSGALSTQGHQAMIKQETQ